MVASLFLMVYTKIDIQVHDFSRKNPMKFCYSSLQITSEKIKTRHRHTAIFYVPDRDIVNIKRSKGLLI